MITPRQIRAARGLLGWDATELSRRSGLSAKTITNIEESRTQAHAASLECIASILVQAGSSSPAIKACGSVPRASMFMKVPNGSMPSTIFSMTS